MDVVLVSHDHYDHLGAHTVGRLARLNSMAKARWVTSLGVGKWLRKYGVDARHISELDWTQSVEVAASSGPEAMGLGLGFGPGLKITGVAGAALFRALAVGPL